jgi:pyridoxine 5-phosphate synthase
VEIHTGAYAEAAGHDDAERELERIAAAADRAAGAGLVVNAGHGLHYDNVAPVAAIRPIREFNIGHAIVARAIFSGLGDAVAEMKRALRR